MADEKKVGRPRIELSPEQWEQAERMAYIQCTGEEIAAILGVSYDTLQLRIKDAGYNDFTDWYKKNSAGGKASLRRRQFDMSKRNASMAIWLGKQWLGQRDNIDHDLNHKGQIKLAYNLEDEPEE